MKRVILAQIVMLLLALPVAAQDSTIDIVKGEHAEIMTLDKTRLAPASPGRIRRALSATYNGIKKAEPVIGVGFFVLYVIELIYL